MRIERDFSAPSGLGQAYDLFDEDGRTILTFGLILFNLLTRRYAIWIELRDYRLADLRRTRKFFEEASKGKQLFCNVAKARPEALRFARFFGFREVAETNDVVVMEYP